MQFPRPSSPDFRDNAASCLTRLSRDVALPNNEWRHTLRCKPCLLLASYIVVVVRMSSGACVIVPRKHPTSSRVSRCYELHAGQESSREHRQAGPSSGSSRKKPHLDKLARSSQPLQLQGRNLLPSSRQAWVLLADDLLDGRRRRPTPLLQGKDGLLDEDLEDK